MASVKMPTAAELAKVGSELGMNLSDADIAFFQETFAGNVAAYALLESLPDNLPPVKYPRTPGYRPEGEENKYNLWSYKSEIKGAPEGKLKGKRVALKDNVCVAGVPMMNGASTLEGYMPDVDATVVTRVLDAGATVVGKVRCEYFCFSGGSHTSSPGPVQNPRKYGYSAGGSSSGSAAVIVTGEADMAIGGDQGGSIRMPASYCGIVGLKPTWGLVPYSGIMPIELTLDHTGPMTGSVADNALMLEVIAGPDGLDPRQMGCTTDAYTKALGGSASGLKIGVVKEGFGHPQSEKVVDELVKKGAAKFKELGATVEEAEQARRFVGEIDLADNFAVGLFAQVTQSQCWPRWTRQKGGARVVGKLVPVIAGDRGVEGHAAIVDPFISHPRTQCASYRVTGIELCSRAEGRVTAKLARRVSKGEQRLKKWCRHICPRVFEIEMVACAGQHAVRIGLNRLTVWPKARQATIVELGLQKVSL